MSYLVRRRRPTPIRIVPRQEASPAPSEGPESPESPDSLGPNSPDSLGPDSPDSPSPTSTGFPESTSVASSEATSTPQADSVESSTTLVTRIAAATGSPTAFPISQAPSSTSSRTSSTSITSVPQSDGSSRKAVSAPTSTATPSTAQSDLNPAGGDAGISKNPSQEKANGSGGVFKSTGAEAALITMCVLGLIAAIIGGILYIKRRRRQQALLDAQRKSIPTNDLKFYRPETMTNAHLTQSTNSTGLFAGDDYQRPETVSTGDGGSRIQPPEPTPNPFADAPRNKAYDQLRGRPRSTTLTDRGSWVANPFRDPESERFDPFGELKNKARNERKRYMEEVLREGERAKEAERREMEERG